MSTIFWLSIYAVHIGATWRIRLNRPCAEAMRPYVKLLYVKLLWPLVVIIKCSNLSPKRHCTDFIRLWHKNVIVDVKCGHHINITVCLKAKTVILALYKRKLMLLPTAVSHRLVSIWTIPSQIIDHSMLPWRHTGCTRSDIGHVRRGLPPVSSPFKPVGLSAVTELTMVAGNCQSRHQNKVRDKNKIKQARGKKEKNTHRFTECILDIVNDNNNVVKVF